MVFSVTPIYALAVAGIYLVLWYRVTAMRGSMRLSIGDAGDQTLLLRIRQHGNCAEWSSFVLILMILGEGVNTSAGYLHTSGALLLVGRVAHPFGLKVAQADHLLRYLGNGTNILAALTMMVCLAIALLT